MYTYVGNYRLYVHKRKNYKHNMSRGPYLISCSRKFEVFYIPLRRQSCDICMYHATIIKKIMLHDLNGWKWPLGVKKLSVLPSVRFYKSVCTSQQVKVAPRGQSSPPRVKISHQWANLAPRCHSSPQGSKFVHRDEFICKKLTFGGVA